MNKIIAKKRLSMNVVRLDIKAPEIVALWKPGQHVSIQIDREAEVIPLVISKVNELTGILSLFIHTAGTSHLRLANMTIGDDLFEVSGPLGTPVDIKNYGTVVCAAGGVGIVPLYPIVDAMKSAGNKVIVILGARTAGFLLLEEEMSRVADEIILMTDDGSLGREGMVTDAMKELFKREKVDRVVTSGPVKMIRHSSALTHMFNIPLIATLYSMNVIGEGNHGIYRVSVCPHSKYICVDGVDFNAFYPNFDTMVMRMGQRLNDEYEGNQSYSKQQLVQY